MIYLFVFLAVFYPFSTLLYHGISQRYNHLHQRPLRHSRRLPDLIYMYKGHIHSLNIQHERKRNGVDYAVTRGSLMS